MFTLQPKDLPVSFRDWFDLDDPAAFRLKYALRGGFPARVFTDDTDQPTWAVLQEMAFGTLYLAGTFTLGQLGPLVADCLKSSAEVLFGYWDWQGDALKSLFPPPQYEGEVLDFSDRDPAADLTALAQLTDGFRFQPVDASLFERSADAAFNRQLYGPDAARRMLGYYVMQGETICAEAFASPPLEGVVEVGMQTLEPYRQRGLATALCAHLIAACEGRGWATYWNCNVANLPSVRIARKLGYRQERPYALIGWFQQPG
jgi:GNAT superfamily N-acetyltransferase